MNLGRIASLAQKEWREILRDRMYLMLAFLMPTVLMLVFGYGISQDVRHMPAVVVDQDHSEASRAYADRFAHSEYFDFLGYAESEHDPRVRVSDAGARVVVVVPPGFQRDLEQRRRAEVQIVLDGSFTSSRAPRTLEGYIDAIDAAASTELQVGALVRRLAVTPEEALTLLDPVRAEVRYLYNPELSSSRSIAPALIMFVLVFAAPMLMALSVVREKETGAIFNVYSSTASRTEFLLGKVAPNAAVSAANSVILWLIAVVHFGAPFRGSLGCFAVGTALYVLAATCLGLVVSLLVRTQAAALMIVGVTATIVGFQYSGLFTPVASLSGLPWALAHAFPSMYYLEVVQGTFLKGLGFSGLLGNLAVLGAFACAYGVLAHGLFHKRVSR